MSTNVELPVDERILRLLHHLGIQKAHFAARMPSDWLGLVSNHPDHIASLALVCPVGGLDAQGLANLGARLLVLSGDQGRPAEVVSKAMASFPQAKRVILSNYLALGWTDIIAERTGEVFSAMQGLLEPPGLLNPTGRVSLRQDKGEVAGITYQVQGTGLPLVLLPLSLAPSQWEPLVPRLGERYCTIRLGGPHVGMVPMLESRGRSGYLRVVRALIDEVHLEPGEQVLEVGCGTGVLDRWLARRTKETNRIVGVDINQYLLGEAKALAQKEGLQKVIEFKEGNAEALPFADNTFDVTMSCTVMEEVDAGRMMSELVRVTRPGGRVAVIVRAVDMPLVVNLPLPATIKAKAETNPGGVAEKGCADASLYRRFLEAGLTQVKMFPQLGAYGKDNSQFLESMILASLDSGEAKAWRAAAAQAQAAGTFLIGYPFHCAVGTKQI